MIWDHPSNILQTVGEYRDAPRPRSEKEEIFWLRCHPSREFKSAWVLIHCVSEIHIHIRIDSMRFFDPIGFLLDTNVLQVVIAKR
jgi:hypothetical protein